MGEADDQLVYDAVFADGAQTDVISVSSGQWTMNQVS